MSLNESLVSEYLRVGGGSGVGRKTVVDSGSPAHSDATLDSHFHSQGPGRCHLVQAPAPNRHVGTPGSTSPVRPGRPSRVGCPDLPDPVRVPRTSYPRTILWARESSSRSRGGVSRFPRCSPPAVVTPPDGCTGERREVPGCRQDHGDRVTSRVLLGLPGETNRGREGLHRTEVPKDVPYKRTSGEGTCRPQCLVSGPPSGRWLVTRTVHSEADGRHPDSHPSYHGLGYPSVRTGSGSNPRDGPLGISPGRGHQTRTPVGRPRVSSHPTGTENNDDVFSGCLPRRRRGVRRIEPVIQSPTQPRIPDSSSATGRTEKPPRSVLAPVRPQTTILE